MSEIDELKNEIRAFADARDWEQFHTPKNLSMAIAGEAGELVQGGTLRAVADHE